MMRDEEDFDNHIQSRANAEYERGIRTCEQCGTRAHKDGMVKKWGYWYCNSCWDKGVPHCENGHLDVEKLSGDGYRCFYPECKDPIFIYP